MPERHKDKLTTTMYEKIHWRPVEGNNIITEFINKLELAKKQSEPPKKLKLLPKKPPQDKKPNKQKNLG